MPPQASHAAAGPRPSGACQSTSSISFLFLPGLASLVTSQMCGVYGARIPLRWPLKPQHAAACNSFESQEQALARGKWRQFDNPRQSGRANRMIRRWHEHCVVKASGDPALPTAGPDKARRQKINRAGNSLPCEFETRRFSEPPRLKRVQNCVLVKIEPLIIAECRSAESTSAVGLV